MSTNATAGPSKSPQPKTPGKKLGPPSTTTFSFKAPGYPASSTASISHPSSPMSKARRVSLASPSSPRVFPAWSFRDDTDLDSHVAESLDTLQRKGNKMRKIVSEGTPDEEWGVGSSSAHPEKKVRKRWTMEETQMLVDGCNRYGVGQWKSILNDSAYKFDNRSPVDLKDRFRTYFPDAYKQQYPNAKTHLSSKVRSTLPDGSSIFEKTRSKKRRPFTEEEDRALRAGYEKHGTVWATIVKDPIFQEQNRRSTDLRDRFRNAFPDLYEAAGYKPRSAAAKKKAAGESLGMPRRAATDDQLVLSTNSTTSPRSIVRRRRANTNQGLFRGGTKSVPQSTTCSEEEDELDPTDHPTQTFRAPFSQSSGRSRPSQPAAASSGISQAKLIEMDHSFDNTPDQSHSGIDMDTINESSSWPTAVDTPSYGPNQQQAWAITAAAGSPTSSHLSSDAHLAASPFHQPTHAHTNGHGRNAVSGGGSMIGKSAWGTQDWLMSMNPRLDPTGQSYVTGLSSTATTSSASSFFDGGHSPSPPSPFSFHNLVDRYDLFPSSPHGFATSEFGLGESHSAFSDDMYAPSGGFRGFTHHSSTAGDLIFGARTHQPQGLWSSFGDFTSAGLGLSGMGQTGATGIHPLQLHAPALPGIDELELTNINLNDQHDSPGDEMEMGVADEPMDGVVASGSRQEGGGGSTAAPNGSFHHKTSSTPISNLDEDDDTDDLLNPMALDVFGLSDLEDLVDLSHEMHSTPPSTPLTSRPRGLRRKGSGLFSSSSHHNQGLGHGRSISVPPSEARGGGSEQQQQRPAQPVHTLSQPIVPHAQTVSFFGHLSQGQAQMDRPHTASSVVHSTNNVNGNNSNNSHPQFSPPSAAHMQQHGQYPSFLDLHYFSLTQGMDGSGFEDPSLPAFSQYALYGQGGEALDLAGPHSQPHSHSYSHLQAHNHPPAGLANGINALGSFLPSTSGHLGWGIAQIQAQTRRGRDLGSAGHGVDVGISPAQLQLGVRKTQTPPPSIAAPRRPGLTRGNSGPQLQQKALSKDNETGIDGNEGCGTPRSQSPLKLATTLSDGAVKIEQTDEQVHSANSLGLSMGLGVGWTVARGGKAGVGGPTIGRARSSSKVMGKRPVDGPGVGVGRSQSFHQHQRRQSTAVSAGKNPNLARDNKRKRASWDGGGA